MEGNQLLFRNSSYTEPSAWYVYSEAERTTMPTPFAETSLADYSNVEVERQIAVSEDGTNVPITIIRSKDTPMDGTNPTVLYGYGGYGSSQIPYFRESISLWLNRGGIYAIANIRGGGEFGEDWHKQGYLTQKQNVFDDFAACGEFLIENNYTNPDRLAIRGGSNGGLLVGAVMVQHPDLFKAVVCQKGVLDMLRVELHPNGMFNTTEFGTVTIKEQFEALYGYSPYHNIKDGVDYPDVLFTADINDGRVDAHNSRKMAASLQALDAVPGQTLLRVSAGGGHGMGMSKSDKISQDADVWAFLFDRLGVGCK
jgi:prolyl oligopeptidase